jgi:hypothetical protein
MVRPSHQNPPIPSTSLIINSHNGTDFNPSNPAGSILQMVRDVSAFLSPPIILDQHSLPTQGTAGTKSGDGLKQCYAHQGNWYAAWREYNSGQVNKNELNDPCGATGSYVRDATNRIMGHVWDQM